jgi:undecaprenyl-diphosphatase
MNGNEPPKRDGVGWRRAVWIGLTVLGVLAAVASYVFLDARVSTWFLSHPNNWHRNPWVDAFRQAGKGGVPIWLLVAWSCLTDKWRPTFIGIAALILVGASIVPVKLVVHRGRPNAVATASRQNTEVPWQAKVSFPSGDTAVVFAVATALSFSFGRLCTVSLFMIAGVIGLLRITSLAHYPSDVLAGATLGMLCGLYAVRWAAARQELDRFRVEGRWRLISVLMLVFVVPFVSPYLGIPWLKAFLVVYIPPLAVLVFAYWCVVRWRARKGASTRTLTLEGPKPKCDLTESTPRQ